VALVAQGMINKLDEPCDGCLITCAWWNNIYDSNIKIKLTPYALEKMKTCPCSYCLVKMMCNRIKCDLFPEHFKNITGSKSIIIMS